MSESRQNHHPQHHWQGVLSSALDAVGHTPLINLQRLAKAENLKCNLLGKCEYFSAGGSVKDRIAKRMIEHAEKSGVLKPGQSVVIEPTSGNTGIGLALACAIKGYQCVIALPAKMSLEKEVMLRALGAEIVRTPTEAAWDAPESHIGVARKLQKSIPHAVILDQYSNPQNPLAHYYSTYGEIMYSLETSHLPRKDIALLVAGAGTGGTITGLSRAIRDEEAKHTGSREHQKRTVVLAVDPVGSILGGGEVGNYEVEGIGYDFFPEVLSPKPPVVDEWIKTNDKDAFAMTKRVIRTEGLFVGGSSGSALSGALQYLRHSPNGQKIAQDPTANVIVILPDGVRNYMSKPWFLSDQTYQHEDGDGEGELLRERIESVLGRGMGDWQVGWNGPGSGIGSGSAGESLSLDEVGVEGQGGDDDDIHVVGEWNEEIESRGGEDGNGDNGGNDTALGIDVGRLSLGNNKIPAGLSNPVALSAM